MDLSKLELWNGAEPVRGAVAVLYDTSESPSKKIANATRVVVEIAPSGIASVVGIELLDLDESGEPKRGASTSYGILAGDRLRTSAEIKSGDQARRDRESDRRMAEVRDSRMRDLLSAAIDRLGSIEQAILQPRGFWDRVIGWWRS